MKPDLTVTMTKDNNDAIKALLGDAVKKALEECGMVAETHASENLTKQLAKSPPSWYKRTGNLRNSISHIVDADKKEMYVGTRVKYAPYVELGTGIYVSGGRRSPWGYVGSDGEVHFTHGMPPRPFIKPSITEHINEYEQIIRSNLQ